MCVAVLIIAGVLHFFIDFFDVINVVDGQLKVLRILSMLRPLSILILGITNIDSEKEWEPYLRL